MGSPHRLPSAALPLPRDEIETILERIIAMERDCGLIAYWLIGRIDFADGDPDFEITSAEDDFAHWPQGPEHGPGCQVSDPAEDDDHGGDEHDGREPEDGF